MFSFSFGSPAEKKQIARFGTLHANIGFSQQDGNLEQRFARSDHSQTDFEDSDFWCPRVESMHEGVLRSKALQDKTVHSHLAHKKNTQLNSGSKHCKKNFLRLSLF